MSITVKLRYLRIAPRKVRLVADLIRGKSVKDAQVILSFTVRKASPPVLKLLKSAIASASHNFQLNEENLYISKITVDEGPKLKRWMARARGQASEIQKKTSHITIVLAQIKIKKRAAKKIKESEESKKIEEAPGLKRASDERPRPRAEQQMAKPRIEKGIRRIFRRKAF